MVQTPHESTVFLLTLAFVRLNEWFENQRIITQWKIYIEDLGYATSIYPCQNKGNFYWPPTRRNLFEAKLRISMLPNFEFTSSKQSIWLCDKSSSLSLGRA